MNLSISNFKLLSCTIALLIALAMVLSTEWYFRKYAGNHDPYQIRDEINLEKPDIIMLGNSMLGQNIDHDLFEKELSELTGRPIHAKFIVFNGCYASLFYIILTEQIATSNVSNIPLGIVDHSFRQFMSTGRGGNEHDTIKQLLVNGDPIFFQKYRYKGFRHVFKLRGIWDTYYYSPGASHTFINTFIEKFLFSHKNILSTLRFRFRGFNSGSFNNFFDNETLNVRKKTHFDNSIENSFLPEIIANSKNFKLFLVTSPSRPSRKINCHRPSHFIYTKVYENYFRKHNVLTISTPAEKLNKPSYFLGKIHLNKKGSVINTIFIARRIFESGLIK